MSVFQGTDDRTNLILIQYDRKIRTFLKRVIARNALSQTSLDACKTSFQKVVRHHLTFGTGGAGEGRGCFLNHSDFLFGHYFLFVSASCLSDDPLSMFNQPALDPSSREFRIRSVRQITMHNGQPTTVPLSESAPTLASSVLFCFLTIFAVTIT